MFIKRAKSRPSLRARESELDDAPASSTSSPLAKSSVTAEQVQNGSAAASAAGEGGEDAETSSGSVMERKKAQKKDKRLGGARSGAGGGPRLSFGGDADEGEGFKPRKSLLSQNIKLPQTPSRDEGLSTPSKSTPSYSSDYLAELKASTPSRLARPAADTGNDEMGEADVHSGSGMSRIARHKYASAIQEDTTAGIPDAVAVAAAKMKRQAALESAKHGGSLGNGSAGEDYIALGKGQLVVHDGAEPHPESRLMREEDEGDEGDEGKYFQSSALSCSLTINRPGKLYGSARQALSRQRRDQGSRPESKGRDRGAYR